MLTQIEADKLVAIEKLFVKPETISLPPSSDLTYELVSKDKQEPFLLDLWRSTFRLSKLKFQNRARQVIVLVRLDVDGAPHTNPDGQRLGALTFTITVRAMTIDGPLHWISQCLAIPPILLLLLNSFVSIAISKSLRIKVGWHEQV